MGTSGLCGKSVPGSPISRPLQLRRLRPSFPASLATAWRGPCLVWSLLAQSPAGPFLSVFPLKEPLPQLPVRCGCSPSLPPTVSSAVADFRLPGCPLPELGCKGARMRDPSPAPLPPSPSWICCRVPGCIQSPRVSPLAGSQLHKNSSCRMLKAHPGRQPREPQVWFSAPPSPSCAGPASAAPTCSPGGVDPGHPLCPQGFAQGPRREGGSPQAGPRPK